MNAAILLFYFGFMPWFGSVDGSALPGGQDTVKTTTAVQPAKVRRPKTRTKRRIKSKNRRQRSRSRNSNRLTQLPEKKTGSSTKRKSEKTSSNTPDKVESSTDLIPKAGAQKKDLDVVIDGIQAFYRSASDLKADFQQTYTYVQMGRKQKKSGRVFFKTPNRMRWDYKKPVPQVFVSDGQTLWVYQPRDAQVFKQNLSTSQLPVALTFMSGKGELRSEFDARLKSQDSKHYLVELIPKLNEGSYRSVILKVKKTDFAVVSSTVVDPVGNLNRVTFTQVKRNTGVPNRAFEFKVPKGVRLIDPPR